VAPGITYYVPPVAIGKRVLLKMKGSLVRIYDDDALLKQYQIHDQKGQVLGIPKAPIRLDPQQTPRHGRDKGKATRGLTTKSLYPEVDQRPISEYERYATGGA